MRKIPHWLEELSPSESLDVLRELAYQHAREGGEQGRLICDLIRRGDFRSLVEFELNYSDPTWTSHAVKQCRQALAFFQKLPDLDIGIDKEDVAMRKFLEAEELCRQTNEILSMLRTGHLSWPSRVNAVFHSATRKIARILGPVPSISELDLRFGPGATRGTKRAEASIRRKVAESLQCSEELLPIAGMLLGELPHLAEVHAVRHYTESVRVDEDSIAVKREVLNRRRQGIAQALFDKMTEVHPDYLDGDEDAYDRWFQLNEEEIYRLNELLDQADREINSLTRLAQDEMVSVPVEIVQARLNFVPKSAKTLRSVNVEAGLNVIFQLGIGGYMAKRLAAFGIDIRDQTLNQRRAREGSLTGALATLDLSSASDTISREIVYELLPLEWASFLNWGRSSRVELPDGSEISQEKFSSMGNGYTFPLETLIFWGLAAACCDRDSDATVYGDDIIIPSDRFDLLSEVLHYAGFKVNAGKSFAHGPFRESCGKDYFKGMDVRPFYMKGWVTAQSLFVLHNFYVRDRNPEMALLVVELIHPSLRLWGPDGYGDGHLIGDHPRKMPHKYAVRGFGGYFFDTLTTKQRRDIVPNAAGDAVLPSYTIYRRSGENLVEVHVEAEKLSSELRESVTMLGDQITIEQSLARIAVKRYRHRVVGHTPLPLAEKEGTKALTLPGVDGYKKITIYTLGS